MPGSQRTHRHLLTGGDGMLGSAIRRALRSHDFIEVIAPSRAELDLSDDEETRAFLRSERIDSVMHCAARVGGIAANIADPTGFLVDNAIPTLTLMRASIESDITDFVFVGSSCMYPRDWPGLLTETALLRAPLEPTNEGYALAKIVGAKFCEYASRQFGVRYSTVVPCNLYGPGDSFDPRRSHLVAACLAKVHEAKVLGTGTVDVWGDGQARREFLFVDDLALFLSAHVGREDAWPVFMNLGQGLDHSIDDYYVAAARAVGVEVELKHDLSKPVGMKRKLLDSSVATSHGWNPMRTLEEGLRITYEWFLEQVDGGG